MHFLMRSLLAAAALAGTASAFEPLIRTLKIKASLDEYDCEKLDVESPIDDLRDEIADALITNSTDVSVFFPDCGLATSRRLLASSTDMTIQVKYPSLDLAEEAREMVDDEGLELNSFIIENIDTSIIGIEDSDEETSPVIFVIAALAGVFMFVAVFFYLEKCKDQSNAFTSSRDVEMGGGPAKKAKNSGHAVLGEEVPTASAAADNIDERPPQPSEPPAEAPVETGDAAGDEDDLPPGWRLIPNDGEPYYWHDERMESSWTMPME